MTVMAEFMFVDWLACLTGTCWIVKCLLPYWRRELKLENSRIKACCHLIFVAMLLRLFVAMPIELYSDPRLGGSARGTRSRGGERQPGGWSTPLTSSSCLSSTKTIATW